MSETLTTSIAAGVVANHLVAYRSGALRTVLLQDLTGSIYRLDDLTRRWESVVAASAAGGSLTTEAELYWRPRGGEWRVLATRALVQARGFAIVGNDVYVTGSDLQLARVRGHGAARARGAAGGGAERAGVRVRCGGG